MNYSSNLSFFGYFERIGQRNLMSIDEFHTLYYGHMMYEE
jgi:hypothetical protein